MVRARKAPPVVTQVPRRWSLGVALAILLIYLALVPPVSGDKDSAEFTIVLALLGVAHPTGYPLFTLLGLVRAAVPAGNFWEWARTRTALPSGWRSTSCSACRSRSCRRMGGSPAARASGCRRAGGLLCAQSRVDPGTTLVEVLCEAVNTAMSRVPDASGKLAEPARSLRGLALRWGFVCGIGAAHHATSVFVVLPLTIALALALRRAGRLSVGVLLLGLLAACVPLLSYGFILWRGAHPAALQWPMLRPGWDGLFEHMTGREYAGLLGHFAPAAPQVHFLLWYILPFLLPGLVLLVLHARHTKDGAAVALAVAAVAGTLYAFSYGVPDPSSYFLYPMAFGLAALAPLLARGSRLPVWLGGSVAIVLCVVWFFFASLRSTGMMEFDALVESMWRRSRTSRGRLWNDDMLQAGLRQQLLHEKTDSSSSIPRSCARPRRKFALAHSFDRCRRRHQGMEEYVNRRTPLPVIDFDPMTRQVRLLKKD
jgi:hypothetical protein